MAENTDSPLTLRLFGPLQILCAGRPLPPLRSQKGKWLLALLALRHGKEVERAWLAAKLWPNGEKSRTSLNTTLSDLRGALGTEAARLVSRGQMLCLNLDGADVDVIPFDLAINSKNRADLNKAVSLYTAALLEGCLEPWVTEEREKRKAAYMNALEILARQALADGDFASAIDYLKRAVALETIEEGTHRLLMQVQADAGEYNAAMQVYYDLRQQLQTLDSRFFPQEATTALYNDIRLRARSLAAPDTKRKPEVDFSSIKVLRPLTALLGRSRELRLVVTDVLTQRLVTLTGIGGVGKTRLATEAAIEVAANFPHGVYLVALETLTEPEQIAQQVGKVLGVERQRGQLQEEALVEFLRARQLLLVLDNCEHLIEGSADLARLLLRSCTGLHILATSRERLGLTGEIKCNIDPLDVPDQDALADLRQCLDYPVIRLFCERATAVRAGFTPSLHNIAPIIHICRRLDGLPLAIELAAAQVEAFSVQDIAAYLDNRFELLRTGDRTVPKRHQALKAALDWSYDRLTEQEQELLRRLCVFAGGWQLQAAEALYPPQPGKQSETRFLLSRLVLKSLVIAREDAAGIRYGMLETIREYGLERVTDVVVWRQIQRAHCVYYVGLVESIEKKLLGNEQGAALDRLEREHDNLRAALAWATGEGGETELAMRLGSALGWFWHARAYYEEGTSWLQRILDMPGEQPDKLRIKVVKKAGNLYYVQGENAAARRYFAECLILAQRLNDKGEQASALASLANIEMAEEHYVQARQYFEESLCLFHDVQNIRGAALTLSNLAILANRSEHNYIRARELHLQGLELFRQLGARLNIAQECNNLAYTLLMLNETDAVLPYLEESLTLNQELDNPRVLVFCISCFRIWAMIRHEMERASVLMGAEVALREKIKFPMAPIMDHDYQQYKQEVCSAIGVAQHEAAFRQGQNLTQAAVIALLRNGADA